MDLSQTQTRKRRGQTAPPSQQPRNYDSLWAQHPRILARLDVLQERVGHQFADSVLLYEALTHRSALMEYGTNSAAMDLPWNERLEFLGDAVLGLCISQRLMVRSEMLAEGQLSRVRAALVNEESLATIARRLHLGRYLIMGKGAAASGGRRRASILADALEALIGAIFSDGGFAAADFVVGRLFSDLLAGDMGQLGRHDFKTMLQELTQEQMKATPTYEVATESGPDHEKKFEVRVLLAGRELGRGWGASKKRASQAAAESAMDSLRREKECES